MSSTTPLPQWTIDDIKQWLNENNLEHCLHVFHQHEINNGHLLLNIDMEQIVKLTQALSLRDQICLKAAIIKTRNAYRKKEPILLSDGESSEHNLNNAANNRKKRKKIDNDDTEFILNLLHGPKPKKHHKSWTKRDDKKLLKLLSEDASMETMIRELQRTDGSIHNRIARVQSCKTSSKRKKKRHKTKRKSRKKTNHNTADTRNKVNDDSDAGETTLSEPEIENTTDTDNSNAMRILQDSVRNTQRSKKRRRENDANHNSNQSTAKRRKIIDLTSDD